MRWLFIYSRMHFLLVLVSGGSKAARMASSNTFFSPRWLKMRQNKSETKKCSFIVLCLNKYIAFSLKLCENLTHTCVRAEHSTYLTALSSRTSFSPLSGYRGRCLFFASFSIVLLSSRRSTCVPTNKKGVRGQWWEISGTHWKKKHIKRFKSHFLPSKDLNKALIFLCYWTKCVYRTKVIINSLIRFIIWLIMSEYQKVPVFTLYNCLFLLHI